MNFSTTEGQILLLVLIFLASVGLVAVQRGLLALIEAIHENLIDRRIARANAEREGTR